MNHSFLKSILMVFILSLVSVQPVLAYIDPNTGGMLFQALAASFAVLTGMALLFSRQIRAGFARARRHLRGLLDKADQDTEQESAD
jgi:hypothetical protein